MPRKKGLVLSIGKGESKGGRTEGGRAKYNKATGSNLKAPVTEKNPTYTNRKRKNLCAGCLDLDL